MSEFGEFDPPYSEMLEKHEQEEIGDFADPEEALISEPILPDEIGGVHISDLTFQILAEMYLALEQRVEQLETKLTMCEMALRVAHLPLPPYEAALAEEA